MSHRTFHVTVDGQPFEVTVEEVHSPSGAAPLAPAHAPIAPATPPPAAANTAPAPAVPMPVAAAGSVTSPLAGRVVSIDCQVGQVVAEGERLVTLEAMKMHTLVYATSPGTVGAVHVNPGDAVEEAQPLVTLN